MTTVDYDIRAPYLPHSNGGRYPGLIVELRNPSDPSQSLELLAELDSGAEYSLVDGTIASSIGLDLMAGKHFVFGLMNGSSLDARTLPVMLAHRDLGEFSIDLRFSMNPLQRNLLGRDFFNLVQIGFRERFLETYLTATP